MGRSPCCAKEGLNRGAWTTLEDKILTNYIKVHGDGKWRSLPRRAGLKRCGKSCRLRWLNYLRPGIKRGNISPDEDELIVRLHELLGNRWSLIAGRLPGRTDNEIKNYWNSTLGKKEHRYTHFSQSSKKHDGDVTKTRKEGGSPITAEQPLTKKDTSVVRPKAVKCSKVFLDQQTQTTTQKSSSVPIPAERMDGRTPNDKPKELNTCEESSLFGSGQNDPDQDFMMNIDAEENILSESTIMSPDEFRDLWDFSCDNTLFSSQCFCSSPMLDQHLMLTEEILQACSAANDCAQPLSTSALTSATSKVDQVGDWLV